VFKLHCSPMMASADVGSKLDDEKVAPLAGHAVHPSTWVLKPPLLGFIPAGACAGGFRHDSRVQRDWCA